MKITFDMRDLARILPALESVADEAARKEAAGGMVDAARQIAEQNFRSPRLRPAEWPPLAEATIAGFSEERRKAHERRVRQAERMRKPRPDPRPLIDESHLIKSLSVAHVREDGAKLVSSTTYAGFHQFGSEKRPGRPPARPFVPVTGKWGGELEPTPAAEERMRRAGERALRRSAGEAGFEVRG